MRKYLQRFLATEMQVCVRAGAFPGMRICSSGPCCGGMLIEATNNTLDAELKNIGGSRPKEYGIEYLSQVSVAGIILWHLDSNMGNEM